MMIKTLRSLTIEQIIELAEKGSQILRMRLAFSGEPYCDRTINEKTHAVEIRRHGIEFVYKSGNTNNPETELLAIQPTQEKQTNDK